MPPPPDCRISAHPGNVARCSAASNSRPAVAGNNYWLCAAAGSADTDRHPKSGRCCSPSTSRTATSTRTRSIRVRSGCDKAPHDGAYPPVRPGCSPRPCLYTRCHRCSSPDGDASRFHRGHRSSSAAAEAAAVVASCSARCCSCIGTGWRGCRCPRMTTGMPSRF